MPNRTFKLYVDDSGTKEYSRDKKYPRSGGKTRFFAFAGLLLLDSRAGMPGKALRRLKMDTFGTASVEIKANWLRIDKERKKRYLDPFDLSESALTAFVDRTYEIITESDLTLFAALVDKQAVQERYPSTWYAPAIAYECLMQRVQMEMQTRDGVVHTTIDDMSGATPKGNQYRDNLIRHHKRLKTLGSSLQPGMTFDRLAGLTFSDSAADNRLQLADLVAYAVYKQFVDYPDAWDGSDQKLPVYKYLERLAPKFRNEDGVISGYGIAKFPLLAGRKRWKHQKT
jgi:hypothetical protein